MSERMMNWIDFGSWILDHGSIPHFPTLEQYTVSLCIMRDLSCSLEDGVDAGSICRAFLFLETKLSNTKKESFTIMP